jgi:CDP-4-dehydro-6-deoxyglucose reductase
MSTSFTLLDVKNLSDDVFGFRLQPKQKPFEFKAGQYIFLLMPNDKKVPLSIASAPEQTDFIELHIRSMPGNDFTADMIKFLQNEPTIEIDGPDGKCCLQNNDNTLVAIAGGTGFSPMKSLIESALDQQTSRKLRLYVGAQESSMLYQTPIVESWKIGDCDFKYTPVINAQESNWTGDIGFPHQIALAELDSCDNCDFYVGGSEAMVLNVYQSLLDAGVNKNNIFSDIIDIKRQMGQLD